MGISRGWAALTFALTLIVGAASCSAEPAGQVKQPAGRGKNAALVAGSKELLGRELPGLMLELAPDEVLKVRHGLRRKPEADREGLKVFHEPLDRARSVLYFFRGEQGASGRLERVQIASSFKGLDRVAERVQATIAHLGSPDGVWDCPGVSGQLPTRRYAYRRGAVSALDVYALIGEQAAVTYYVAATSQIRASLRDAGCVPTPPERATRFPVAVP